VATRQRVEVGQRLLADAELRPQGFVAPGYACTKALREVVSALPFDRSADLGGVNTRGHGRIRCRALCLGTSTPLKRALSPTVVRAAARLLVAGGALPAPRLRGPRDCRALRRASGGCARQRVLRARPARARLDGEQSERWARRAARTEAALLERCRDERTGLFFDLAGRGERAIRRRLRHPVGGHGRARDFGFSTLLVDLLAQSGNMDPEPSAGQPMMQP
jgi:hypothetical protein